MKTDFLKVLSLIIPVGVIGAQSAFAETIHGRLNGYDCAHAGVTCPIDPQDPHVNIEPDFVLQHKNGDYTFLPNIPRKTKIKYVLQSARVEGDMSKKYNSMRVDKLSVKKDGKWEVVWNKDLVPKIKLETITGRMNGHDCVHGGISCPVEAEDPHIFLERDFVLQKEDGDYYFLLNLPRSTKLQYIFKDIQISGELNRKYNSVIVHEMMVMEDDEWKTVWIKRE